jgi:crotonobetaine/carnitine-CoA ligase
MRKPVALLRYQVEVFASKPLLVIGDKEYSCEEICRRAGETAGAMHAAGVERGDRVAILCGNRIEFLAYFLGCAWLGAVAVPINQSSRGPQLQHILKNSGAKLLVIEAYIAEALEVLDAGPLSLTDIWLLSNDGCPSHVTIGEFSCVSAPQGGPFIEPVESRPSDTCAIIYTSGTTGASKGVMCPHAQFFWWGLNCVESLEIGSNDVLLTTLPLFHVNALGAFFQALISGATLVVLERFSASGFVPSLQKYKATITYLLGAMASILLSTPINDADRNHGTWRALAPGVPAAFAKAFEERFGIGLINGYGSTETNAVISGTLLEHARGSMGLVRPGYHAEVFDEDDNVVPHGTSGELVIRSDIPHSMAIGYFNEPEASLASRKNLWFHTGDRVYRDEGGHFYFIDRMKDAIRRRGENISAFEVEQVLLSHPAVAHAAVFAITSEMGEDEVMAAIITHEGRAIAPEALLDFCQPRMTYFSVPRYVDFLDALPVTENGKVQKFKLRARGVTDTTWDREKAGYSIRKNVRRPT